jgi:hypothetical protein
LLCPQFTENPTQNSQHSLQPNKMLSSTMTMAMHYLWLVILLLNAKQVEPNFGSRSTLPLSFIPHHTTTIKNLQVASRGVAQERIKRIEGTLLMVSPEVPVVREDYDVSHKIASWSVENVQKCADLWKLTPEDEMKLNDLQGKLADIKHPKNDPYEIVRFLQEYKGNVDSSERNFRKMIDWRIENNVDNFLEEYMSPSLYRYFPAAVLKGVDRDGDPIHIERTGAADSSSLLNRYGRDEMVRYSTWIREVQSNGKWRKEYEQSQGHPIKKFTVIMDMQGLGRKNMSPSLMSVGQEVGRLIQDNYPNYAKRIIFIRSPAIFRVAWNIFLPFIDKSLQDVMVFASEKNYREVLEKYIDPKVLPSIIHPEGQGEAVDEFDPVWDGGSIPDHEEPPRCLPVVIEKEVLWEVPVPQEIERIRVQDATETIQKAALFCDMPQVDSIVNNNNKSTSLLLRRLNPILRPIRRLVRWAFRRAHGRNDCLRYPMA